MRLSIIKIFLCAALCTNEVYGFRPIISKAQLRSSLPKQHTVVMSSLAESFGYLETFATPLRPLVSALPEHVLQWGHPAAMGTVLLVQCGIGAYFGFKIRAGEGSSTSLLTLGRTMKEMHPISMGLALVFFLMGSQGGLLSLFIRDHAITESAHFNTAIAGLGCLFVQALLPLFFEKGGKTARTLHASFGTATLALLLVHGFNGLNLGLSMTN